MVVGDGSGAQRAGNSAVDASMSLSSTDNPGAMITSVLLTGENYNEWASEMLNALQAKKKTGYIDGSKVKPTGPGNNHESWIAVNFMVVGWL
ncbi:unnamed protein product [Microthlaspi erraticum]|uniref:Retrotransposon Copia-like N-terminal domain-containing protein n=1 Tax=Microthlaspi erraticum TaxID=1685480 RepID=A0A6D2KAV8_9BRAS|nr:unnamed protein product [Microthlaspi erraticum]